MAHKWSCPHEWLRDYVQGLLDERKYETLATDFVLFAGELDHDTIQNYFEKDMDADGYFEEVE